MSPVLDAVVSVIHSKFWGEAGEGTRYLNSPKRPMDLRDVALDVSTFMADEVAGTMEAIHGSPALVAELAALQEDWEAGAVSWEDGLLILKASLTAHGII